MKIKIEFKFSMNHINESITSEKKKHTQVKISRIFNNIKFNIMIKNINIHNKIINI